MRAAVLIGTRTLDVRDVPTPVPGHGEVLVQMKAVGICGTDLHIFKGKHPAVRLPIIMGHEATGTVAAAGPESKNFRRGDRVVVDPVHPCQTCLLCRKGQYYQCDNRVILGLDRDGAFAECFVALVQNCHKLPEHMSWEDAAFVDTLACAIHGMQRVSHSWGETVAILGPGPAGLSFASLAKLSGASKVILVGTRQAPLEMGRRYGADIAIDIESGEDVVGRVMAETAGTGVDSVFECCGQGSAIRQAIEIVRKQGRILIYGSFPEPVDGIDVQGLRRKEVTIFTSMGPPWAYEDAIKLIVGGRVNVRRMITHRFGLDELDEAFEAMETGEGGYIKGVVEETTSACETSTV